MVFTSTKITKGSQRVQTTLALSVQEIETTSFLGGFDKLSFVKQMTQQGLNQGIHKPQATWCVATDVEGRKLRDY